MRKYRFTVAFGIAAIIAFTAILGWAGDCDFCDQVILNMTQEQYDSVRNLLKQQKGVYPSEREIAHWWVDHQNE